MPRIRLKPNSPEFADPSPSRMEKGARCQMPGCSACGEHRAPKDRGLKEYYLFCLDHVREYNKAWNFFSGMAPHEVEEHVTESVYGFRPTRRYDTEGAAEDFLRGRAYEFQHGTDGPKASDKTNGRAQSPYGAGTPEFDALAIMGLQPPLRQDKLKARYRELAKQHHPDLNQGCSKSEELLKQINMAYTILKLACEKYDKMMQD